MVKMLRMLKGLGSVVVVLEVGEFQLLLLLLLLLFLFDVWWLLMAHVGLLSRIYAPERLAALVLSSLVFHTRSLSLTHSSHTHSPTAVLGLVPHC